MKTTKRTRYIMDKQPQVPCPRSCRTSHSVVW